LQMVNIFIIIHFTYLSYTNKCLKNKGSKIVLVYDWFSQGHSGSAEAFRGSY
jgi:hypothetical protein